MFVTKDVENQYVILLKIFKDRLEIIAAVVNTFFAGITLIKKSI